MRENKSRANDLLLSRQVHFGEISDGMLKGICTGAINSLLGLHGCDHDTVVCLEGVGVVLLGFKGASRSSKLFDPLAEAVLRDQGDDLAAVFLLRSKQAV